MINFKCRICFSTEYINILNYGKVALSGNFLKKKNIISEIKYPLNLCICKKCKHLQIKNILKPKILFSNYVWKTGDSLSNIYLIKDLLKLINIKSIMNKNKKLLEIASNDGTLLALAENKYKTFAIGVEPAKNLYLLTSKKKY